MYGHIKYATTGGPFPEAGQEFRIELFINDHFVGECTNAQPDIVNYCGLKH